MATPSLPWQPPPLAMLRDITTGWLNPFAQEEDGNPFSLGTILSHPLVLQRLNGLDVRHLLSEAARGDGEPVESSPASPQVCTGYDWLITNHMTQITHSDWSVVVCLLITNYTFLGHTRFSRPLSLTLSLPLSLTLSLSIPSPVIFRWLVSIVSATFLLTPPHQITTASR